jgi:hypothetical protein
MINPLYYSNRLGGQGPIIWPNHSIEAVRRFNELQTKQENKEKSVHRPVSCSEVKIQNFKKKLIPFQCQTLTTPFHQ